MSTLRSYTSRRTKTRNEASFELSELSKAHTFLSAQLPYPVFDLNVAFPIETYLLHGCNSTSFPMPCLLPQASLPLTHQQHQPEVRERYMECHCAFASKQAHAHTLATRARFERITAIDFKRHLLAGAEEAEAAEWHWRQRCASCRIARGPGPSIRQGDWLMHPCWR